ncbi:hypothetical protein [Desulfosporosinus fructosivorans]
MAGQGAAATTVLVEKNVNGEIIAKTCSICDEYKELEDFARDKRGFVGRAADCKACAKAIKDRWEAIGRADLEALYAEGLSEDEIAERYNVATTTVIVRRNQCGLNDPNATQVRLADRKHRRPW